MGPSASAGAKVNPPTTAMTIHTRATNSVVWVCSVPALTGAGALRASDPASASVGAISQYRPMNIAMAPRTLRKTVFPANPANADPLLFAILV